MRFVGTACNDLSGPVNRELIVRLEKTDSISP